MLLQRPLHTACVVAFAVAISATAIPTVSASTPAPPAMTGLTAAPAATSVVAASIPKLSREVFGFTYSGSLTDPRVGYPSWNFGLLSTVAFFGLYVNWDGNINVNSSYNVWNSSALTDLVQTAHSHGTKVVVTIVLGDFTSGTRNMCAGLINRARTIKQTVAQVAAKHVDGVNIDYESNNATCSNGKTSRSMLVQFAHDLRAALPSSSYLSIDTYASSAGDPAGFFDVPGLSPYVNSFFVMAYDLAWSNYHHDPLNCTSFCMGPPAPVGGYYYSDTAIAAQYSDVVPASKVLLGVPYYGNKACVTAATANAYPATGVTAQSYLNAAAEASASSVKAGTYAIHRDANDPRGKDRWDTWYDTAAGCTRELYWDDATALGAKYDVVNSAGLRGVGIWTLNYGGGAPELWAALANHFAPCRSVAVATSPTGSANVGTAVTVAAHATGCRNPVYQFSVMQPGSSTYQIAQPYSTAATLSWKTAGLVPGAYRFSVLARNADGTGVFGNSTARWDSYNNNTVFSLKSCTSVSVTTSPTSPAGIGTAITVSAHASGCAHPEYHFAVLAPGATAYQTLQDYSTQTTYAWSTAGVAVGVYRFSVWAKDVNSGGATGNSAGRWDAYNNGTQYGLMPVCSNVTVTVSPPSPAAVGTAVLVTAHATGCPNPVYHFGVLAPGATTYATVQQYSTKDSFSWTTAGKAPGQYRFSVWARDAASSGLFGNSAGRWDAYDNGTVYSLTPVCTSVSVTVTPTSPAKASTGVTVTAHATGCSSPLFHFALLAPGATTYTTVQDYSSSGVFKWTTTGLATGTYRFSVWARDSNSAGTQGNTAGRWDTYNNTLTFTLT